MALRQQVEALTGLRGLAVLLVFIGHLAQFYLPPAPALEPMRHAAFWGMTLFFTLSGFVIHWNYGAQLRPRAAWWQFFVARFSRLFPLHFAAVVLAALVVGNPPLGKTLLHVAMLQAWPYPPGGINMAWYNTWSISVEWFCYLAYAAIGAAVLQRWRFGSMPLLALVIVGSLAIHAAVGGSADESGMWLRYHSPYLHLLEFVTGGVAAKVVMERQARGASALPELVVLIAFAATLIFQQYTTLGAGTEINYLISPLVAVTLIVACDPRGLLAEALASRWLCWVGDRSYSIYLIQAVLMIHFGAVLERLGYAPSHSASFASIGYGIVLCVLVIAAVLGLSDLSWRFYEMPARRYLNRLRSVRWSAWMPGLELRRSGPNCAKSIRPPVTLPRGSAPRESYEGG
jgi:peptidoglycan/LPS O-acetylase OafA/YrhL